MNFVIKVSDYTKNPGASGRAFWANSLCHLVEYAVNTGSMTITIDLDGTSGYPASWMYDVFYTLGTEFYLTALKRCLKVKSVDEPYLEADAWCYIKEASESAKKDKTIEHVIHVNHFSVNPAGRNFEDGSSSAAHFLKFFVLPAAEIAKSKNQMLVIDMNGVIGYGSNWLHQVFASLSMKYGRLECHRFLDIRHSHSSLVKECWGYVDSCPD